MLIQHDPDATIPVASMHTCDYHKAHPGVPWPGCTCGGSLGLRQATPEERKERRRARLLKRREELHAELAMLDGMLGPNS